IYFAQGGDMGSTVSYVLSNRSTVALAVQIVAMSILFSLRCYVAGAILMITALLTVFGVIF
ncbi:MAG: hypothetical protein Q4Q58_07090, partial [Thermoplasmata archaeon]|nr:hypothetical protein [Thermoplasmata archaeon]